MQSELAGDENGGGVLERQLGWLIGVLATRAYPLERLARDLEIAADVVIERSGPVGPPIARRLLAGADAVRARIARATRVAPALARGGPAQPYER